MKAFQWFDTSNTGRRKPPYLQGYEDGYMQMELRDGELYESEKDKYSYVEGHGDASRGLPNQLEQS